MMAPRYRDLFSGVLGKLATEYEDDYWASDKPALQDYYTQMSKLPVGQAPPAYLQRAVLNEGLQHGQQRLKKELDDQALMRAGDLERWGHLASPSSGAARVNHGVLGGITGLGLGGLAGVVGAGLTGKDAFLPLGLLGGGALGAGIGAAINPKQHKPMSEVALGQLQEANSPGAMRKRMLGHMDALKGDATMRWAHGNDEEKTARSKNVKAKTKALAYGGGTSHANPQLGATAAEGYAINRSSGAYADAKADLKRMQNARDAGRSQSGMAQLKQTEKNLRTQRIKDESDAILAAKKRSAANAATAETAVKNVQQATSHTQQIPKAKPSTPSSAGAIQQAERKAGQSAPGLASRAGGFISKHKVPLAVGGGAALLGGALLAKRRRDRQQG